MTDEEKTLTEDKDKLDRPYSKIFNTEGWDKIKEPVSLVNVILTEAIKRRASDVHFEPLEKVVRVRYRIDGLLYPVFFFSKDLHPGVVSRIKVLSRLDVAERRLPQEGRFKMGGIDVRVSIIPAHFGEKVALRILDIRYLKGLTIDKLGLEEEILKKYTRAISRPFGMIIIAGPTGSGKTTTLYAAIRALNTPQRHILTIEDPIEYEIEGVNQVQVRETIGLTFPAVLRAFLRQDPDIIMLGEMRDPETAEVGIRSALTGHLLLTTLHTNNAVGAIARLINLKIPTPLLASALIFVGAQRLIRKVCPKCAIPYKPSPELLEKLGIKIEDKDIIFYRANGCSECNNLGYKGRVAIMEALEITEEIRNLILTEAPESQIKKAALSSGMLPIKDVAMRKVLQGETTLEEVMRVIGDE